MTEVQSDECTCRPHMRRDEVIEFTGPRGELLFYVDKYCPQHGVRYIDTCETSPTSEPSLQKQERS